MTAFVESFSTRQLLPPWISQGLRMWTFVIKVFPHCLQDYLDSHFNAPGPDLAPYRYQALDGMSFGLLCVASHPAFASAAPSMAALGTITRNDVYWTFPARRWRVTADNLLVDPALVWVQPFLFDNNSYVMFSSREIWGIEAQTATIVLEGATPADLHVDVAIDGLATFSPRSICNLIGAIHVRMNPDAAPDDPNHTIVRDPALAQFFQLLSSSVDYGPEYTARRVHGDSAPAMELNTLKQFRDVFDMRYAAYRALVASRTQHTGVRDIAFYDGAHVAANFMWSDSTKEAFTRLFGLMAPIGEGAPAGHPVSEAPLGGPQIDWNLPCVPVPVALAISYTADARFDVLGTLHTYGQSV